VLLRSGQRPELRLLFRMPIDLAELPSDPELLQQVVRELAEALASKDAEVERLRRVCPKFRVRAMTMGRKEPSHGTPQTPGHP
jgi:hypothetical protein